jgi:hypothetical protein
VVVPVNGGEGVADGADVVVLLLLHVAVHALHAHHSGFLLAVEHQRLLVHVALHLWRLLALPALVVRRPVGRVVAGLAVPLVYIRRLPLGIDVVSPLSVGHFAELAFTELAIAVRVVLLLKLLLT